MSDAQRGSMYNVGMMQRGQMFAGLAGRIEVRGKLMPEGRILQPGLSAGPKRH